MTRGRRTKGSYSRSNTCLLLLLLPTVLFYPPFAISNAIPMPKWDKLDKYFKHGPLLTREVCNKASHGHVWPGDTVYPPLKKWLGVDGPVLKIPDMLVDITTVNTLVQLATPGLKLVLDPIMYLQAMPHEGHIPKVIHMTMRSKHKVAPHQVLSILSWGKLNHGYTLLMYDDADIEAYMKKFYPKVMSIYRRLTTPVERSDLWRYLVLCKHGGVYADTDTVCSRSLDNWMTPQQVANLSTTVEPGMVVGIENVFPSQEAAEEATYVRKVQMIQWALAAKKSHPIVCGMAKSIRAFMDKEEAEQLDLDAKMGHDASILLRTGPGIWTDGVNEYLQELGTSLDLMVGGGQISDVVVLPQAAFGCNVRYWATNNVDSLVYHMYNNSWKRDHFSVGNKKKSARLARERQQRQERLRYFAVVAVIAAGLCYVAYVLLRPVLDPHGQLPGLPLTGQGARAGAKRAD